MRYFVLTFIFVLVGLAGLSAYRSFTTETGPQTKPATGGIQDVAGITVDMLNTRDDGVKAVRYERIIPVLIEAVKELSDRISALESS